MDKFITYYISHITYYISHITYFEEEMVSGDKDFPTEIEVEHSSNYNYNLNDQVGWEIPTDSSHYEKHQEDYEDELRGWNEIEDGEHSLDMAAIQKEQKRAEEADALAKKNQEDWEARAIAEWHLEEIRRNKEYAEYHSRI